MKRKKFPIIPLAVVAALLGGVIYTRVADLQPKVGTAEELNEMIAEREKKKAESEMKQTAESPLGKSRTAPSATEIAQDVPKNLNAMKKPRTVTKARVALIWNSRARITKDTLNPSAPNNSWFRPDSGRKDK